jgi:hypothetical protein
MILRKASFFILIWGILFLVVFAAFSRAQNPGLADFQIKDQHGTTVTSADFLNSIVLIIGSDRGGSAFNPQWDRAIQGSLIGQTGSLDGVRIIAVADMRGVPGFLRGMVTGEFRKKAGAQVLMDWDGVLPQAYGFIPDASNIVVLDQASRSVYQTTGKEVEEEKVLAVTEAIAQLKHVALSELSIVQDQPPQAVSPSILSLPMPLEPSLPSTQQPPQKPPRAIPRATVVEISQTGDMQSNPPPLETAPADADEAVATLGGGDFIFDKALFETLKDRGVLEVVLGFSGGTGGMPNWEDVYTGKSDHAEVVQITFRPDAITYKERTDANFWQSVPSQDPE